MKPRQGINNFLERISNLLEEDVYSDIVSWSSQGDCIVIKDALAFQDKILPTLFGHNNFHSFVRQLNMYNFKKTKADGNACAYCHPNFRKGRKDLLPRVQRKPVKKKEKTPLKLETDIHSFETTNIRETPQKDLKVNECLSYHDEIKFLVNEQQVTKASLENLKGELNMLKEEFAALYKEHIALLNMFNQQNIEQSTLIKNFNHSQYARGSGQRYSCLNENSSTNSMYGSTSIESIMEQNNITLQQMNQIQQSYDPYDSFMSQNRDI